MTKKRILIITQYFYPEDFRINDLSVELVSRGYHVDALVGIPNYPTGKYFKGYGIFSKRKESMKGVTIYRCFQFPRGKKASNIRLSLNYISYMICASLWVLFFFNFKKKYDAIIAFEPSPITQIIPAILLGRIKNIKVISWIQDIWPDSITNKVSDKVKRILEPPLLTITEFVYTKSDRILISSKGMQKLICRSRNYSDKIDYMPNWSADFLKISHKVCDIPDFPNGFLIMMAGNLVETIDPECLCKCASLLKDVSDIHFIFVGSGSFKDKMEQMFLKNGIKNAHFYGRYPYESMPSFYAKANAMLISLAPQESEHLDVTVPSRLQSYMSAGKPIYAMIGSGAREVIESADCGFVVDNGHYEELAKVIRNTYKDTEILKIKGNNARIAFERQFTIEKGVAHFEKIINTN